MAPHLQAIKSVMEQEYLRFAIPMYEYRQFAILPKKDDNASSPPNQATNLEEVLVRANITWEALLNLVNQRINTEFVDVLSVSQPIPKVLRNGQKEEYLGGEENVEMGTQKQEKE